MNIKKKKKSSGFKIKKKLSKMKKANLLEIIKIPLFSKHEQIKKIM